MGGFKKTNHHTTHLIYQLYSKESKFLVSTMHSKLIPLVLAITRLVFSDELDATALFGDDMMQLPNIGIWMGLAPKLHILDTTFQKQMLASWTDQMDEATELELVERMVIEGYFQLSPQQYNLPLQEMTELMDKLHEMSLPVVFCFMYDEFWLPFLRVDGLMKRVLGDGYLKLPDFWAWRIDPTIGESGWEPHMDKKSGALFENGMPHSLTMWIPLSDATVDNGCM
jgi:hypothetical protein